MGTKLTPLEVNELISRVIQEASKEILDKIENIERGHGLEESSHYHDLTSMMGLIQTIGSVATSVAMGLEHVADSPVLFDSDNLSICKWFEEDDV